MDQGEIIDVLVIENDHLVINFGAGFVAIHDLTSDQRVEHKLAPIKMLNLFAYKAPEGGIILLGSTGQSVIYSAVYSRTSRTFSEPQTLCKLPSILAKICWSPNGVVVGYSKGYLHLIRENTIVN